MAVTFPSWSQAPSNPWAPCWPDKPRKRSGSVENAELLSIGLNCATGPEFMTDHIRTLSEMAPPGLLLPQRRTARRRRQVSGNAAVARRTAGPLRHNGWLNMVGGCCGTTEKHIQAIAQMVEGTQAARSQGFPAPGLLFAVSKWWKRKKATAR